LGWDVLGDQRHAWLLYNLKRDPVPTE